MHNKVEVIHVKYNNTASVELFKNFFDVIYCTEFPDPDERDSWNDLLKYLKQSSSNDKNELYFVKILVINGSVAGGVIFDYLPQCNWGVIEYIAIKEDRQNQGWGSKLLKYVHEKLEETARRNGYQRVKAIAVEANDPKTTDISKDKGNTIDRLNFWGKLGYKHLEFPYRQPALDDSKNAVSNLLLLGYISDLGHNEYIDSRELNDFIEEYVSSDGWINDLSQNYAVNQMLQWLDKNSQIKVSKLDIFFEADSVSEK